MDKPKQTRGELVEAERVAILPELRHEFELNGHRWVVSYLNHGQMRFSALWLGKVKAKENVTLDVHSTQTKTQSKIK